MAQDGLGRGISLTAESGGVFGKRKGSRIDVLILEPGLFLTLPGLGGELKALFN